jgi:catechol 2,3-dioxygenase-like lactoylglutathione lyase family enzyme
VNASPAVAALGPPVQIAYAVDDAVEAAIHWSLLTGAGPFFVRSHIELVDVVVRGRPGRFDHTSAYGQWGPLMLELVQDHGDGPSPVRDVFAPGESGLHHLAFFVDDLGAALQRFTADGYEVAMSARTPGGVEFHFVDALRTHGHMLELYRADDRLRAFYSMVADAARDWNGADPVRML